MVVEGHGGPFTLASQSRARPAGIPERFIYVRFTLGLSKPYTLNPNPQAPI